MLSALTPSRASSLPQSSAANRRIVFTTDQLWEILWLRESPQLAFWLIFALPFQQGEYHPSKLASQHHQRLSGAEPPSSLFFVIPFPGFRTASRHRCIVQKSAGLGVTALGQTAASVFLS